jgi:hypothetical protein
MFAALVMLAGLSLLLFLSIDRLARHWDRT